MADFNTELPHALRTELRHSTQAMQTIPALEAHLTQIQKHGMSVRTAVSIESHFPGLLLPNAPSAYSYKSSPTNVVYSQEAIMDKIRKIKAGASTAITKVIEWLRAQCKKIKSVFTKERFTQAAQKEARLSKSKKGLNVADVISKLGDSVSIYNEHPINIKMSEIIGDDITLDKLSNVRTGADGQAWVTNLMHLKKKELVLMVYPAGAKNVLSKLRESASAIENEVSNQGIDTALSERRDNWDQMMEWYFKFPGKQDLVSAYHDACDGTAITEMLSIISDLEVIIDNLSRKHKERGELQSDRLANSKEASDKHDKAKQFITEMEYAVKLYRESLSNSLTLLSWAAYSMQFVTPEQVRRMLAEVTA